MVNEKLNDREALAYLEKRKITSIEQVTEADRKRLYAILSVRHSVMVEAATV